MHESLEIEIKLNEQQQELLSAILHTHLDSDNISNHTKAIINSILQKMEEQYEQDIR